MDKEVISAPLFFFIGSLFFYLVYFASASRFCKFTAGS